jgi:hypothetical protein
MRIMVGAFCAAVLLCAGFEESFAQNYVVCKKIVRKGKNTCVKCTGPFDVQGKLYTDVKSVCKGGEGATFKTKEEAKKYIDSECNCDW